jgi:hypothetical protein
VVHVPRYADAVTIVDAAFWALCLVLAASGATKVADPSAFAAALRELGLPGVRGGSGRSAAVIVGVVEVGLGLNGLVLGGWLAAGLAAVAYGAFTVVVLVARRRGLASCGCFGQRSGAPTLTHAAINAVSAVVCAAAAVVGPSALAVGLEPLPVAAAIAVVLSVLAAAVVIVVVDTR